MSNASSLLAPFRSGLSAFTSRLSTLRRVATGAGSLSMRTALLAKLRFQLRLCHDLKLLSTGQYEHGARMLAEMGRLLGAWLKQQGGRERV